MKKYTLDDFARLIDHTNLKPAATRSDLKILCDEAKDYHFKMVAINQVQAKFCQSELAGTDIHVGAAIAFPLGQTTIEAKEQETLDAIRNGADEIDYVINLTEVKERNYAYIEKEMSAVVAICQKYDVISKVIFETCYLTKEEIQKVAEVAKKVQPDFVKTSTGFGSAGATVEDVALMKKVVGDPIKVKAAGGIRDVETFLAMIAAGAERIGTSSGMLILDNLATRFEKEGIDFIEI